MFQLKTRLSFDSLFIHVFIFIQDLTYELILRKVSNDTNVYEGTDYKEKIM